MSKKENIISNSKKIDKSNLNEFKKIKEIYHKMERVYVSKEWTSEYNRRTMYLFSVEKKTNKKLEPNKNILSEYFNI